MWRGWGRWWDCVVEVKVEFVVSYSLVVLGAREFDRAAVSAVRVAYKSLPRVCGGVKTRDASILSYNNYCPSLYGLFSNLLSRTSIAISRASPLTLSSVY